MKRIALILALIAVDANAQTVNPPIRNGAAVCVYNAVVPATVNGQFFYVQCDSAGRLKLG